MKPEKMTDEELDRALKRLMSQTGVPDKERIRAHIAALTAERDEAQRAHGETATRLNEVIASTANEADALRERVQALETCLIEERAHHDEGRAELTSRLAAIRQRAGDHKALVRKGEVCAIMGSPRFDWDDAIHTDVQQRGDANTVRDVTLGIARYILGDDAPEVCAEPATAGTSTNSASQTVILVPSPPLGIGGDGWVRPIGTTYARTAPWNNSAAMRAMHDKTRPDLTTAESHEVLENVKVTDEGRVALASPRNPTMTEAFATMRNGLCEDSRGADADAALALLERRMGAMALALRGCRTMLKCSDGCACDVCAALTDGPAVFTLEDSPDTVARVADAIRYTAVGRDDYEAQEERARAVLAALRR